METALLDQLDKLCKDSKYTAIIDIVENLNQSEWNYFTKGILAEAYVNKSNNEKAIEILLSENSKGNNDPLWNYRLGLAYLNDNEPLEAQHYFKKCMDLGNISNGHSEYYIKRCIDRIELEKKLGENKVSLTAYHLKVQSVVDDDYSYVTIGLTWKNKKYLEIPTDCKKTQVMWSHESVYGAVGPKVGDFIAHYGESSSLQEGVFTHRHIAEFLTSKYSGLKFNELIWHENPYEKVLRSGKPRLKKAKWLPEKEVDLVHLYSDQYIDVCNQTTFKTDFFNIFRINGTGKKTYKNTWLMCTKEIAKKLYEMNYTGLYLQKTTIKGIKKIEETASR